MEPTSISFIVMLIIFSLSILTKNYLTEKIKTEEQGKLVVRIIVLMGFIILLLTAVVLLLLPTISSIGVRQICQDIAVNVFCLNFIFMIIVGMPFYIRFVKE